MTLETLCKKANFIPEIIFYNHGWFSDDPNIKKIKYSNVKSRSSNKKIKHVLFLNKEYSRLEEKLKEIKRYKFDLIFTHLHNFDLFDKTSIKSSFLPLACSYKNISIHRKKNLKEVNNNWTLNHAKILKAAASDNRVDRIFINAPAKIWMCENMEGSKKWLQKIRPIWGHHSHFHVRLKCPKASPECVKQKPTVTQISKSPTGCDETLYWWVTKALEPPDTNKKKTIIKKKKGARDYTMNDLPKMCLNIIHGK